MQQENSLPIQTAMKSPFERLLQADPSRIILIFPVIFFIHAAEEAPGFVQWINAIIRTDISVGLFYGVNFAGLLITLFLSYGFYKVNGGPVLALILLAWLSFAFLANALLHVTATIVFHNYSPGVISAVLLYLPFFGYFFLRVMRFYNIGLATAFFATLLGAIPMLAHAYYIIFQGDRLF